MELVIAAVAVVALLLAIAAVLAIARKHDTNPPQHDLDPGAERSHGT